MRYFKNSEIMKHYDVSDKAVRNWIEAASNGKNSLDIYESNGRFYIADTLSNSGLLEKLASEGRKYRNRRSHQNIKVRPELYEIYTEEEIVDIVNNLEKYKEIPCHYRYRGEAAHYWSDYLTKLSKSDRPNMLNTSHHLIDEVIDHLKKHAAVYDHINIVDIGVGNGMAARTIVKELHSTGKLASYIGIDNSTELLDLAEQNIQEWTNNKLIVTKLKRDLRHQGFAKELAHASFTHDDTKNLNIILFLGGTIGNFREPSHALKTIRESIHLHDILITTDKLDSTNARRFFDFNTPEDIAELALYNRFILELLGIERSMYKVEQYFDANEHARRIQIKLKVSLTLEFKINGFIRKIELDKNDTLLLLRLWEWSSTQLSHLYTRSGFKQLRTILSDNEEYILLVSKIDPTVKSPLI